MDARRNRILSPSASNSSEAEVKQTSLEPIHETQVETHTEQPSSNSDNDSNTSDTDPDVPDDRQRQFDFHVIQLQNEKLALQHQLQEMNQRVAELQYQQAFYAHHNAAPGMSNFNVSKHIGRPEQFSGESKSDPDTWIAQMRNFLLLTGTPPNIQSQVAGTYLKGAAAQWYNTLPVSDRAKLINFEALAQAILGRFRPLDIVAQARRKLAKLFQTGSVDSFNQQFMALMSLIPTMYEEERVNTYRTKLKRELQVHLVTQEYHQLADIMNVALRTDALLYENNMIGQRGRETYRSGKYRSGSGTNQAVVPVNHVKVDETDHTSEISNPVSSVETSLNFVAPSPLTDAERQRCRELGLCFRCRQKGHRSANCTAFPPNPNHQRLKPSTDISSKKW